MRQHKPHRKRRLPEAASVNNLKQYGILFVTLLTLHVISMIIFEDMALFDALWLTTITVSTVGYGDIVPVTSEGKIATMLFIYFGGGIIFTQIALFLFELRRNQHYNQLHGKWKWNMSEHIVFFNAPSGNYENYFFQAIRQLRHSSLKYHDSPIIIVSELITKPLTQRLLDLDVVHVQGYPNDPDIVRAASIRDAHTIVVLTHDIADPMSDSLNFDIIHRLREENVRARIIAEAVTDENRKRLIAAGADHVIRPVRAYPEMITRTILAPGIENVIEELFSSQGEECVRYERVYKGPWKKVMISMLEEDIGTPIAYLDHNNRVHTNPSPVTEVHTKAVFVIIREDNMIHDDA
ncbi:MAG: ion channel [Pseudomonadota bacterium]